MNAHKRPSLWERPWKWIVDNKSIIPKTAHSTCSKELKAMQLDFIFLTPKVPTAVEECSLCSNWEWLSVRGKLMYWKLSLKYSRITFSLIPTHQFTRGKPLRFRLTVRLIYLSRSLASGSLKTLNSVLLPNLAGVECSGNSLDSFVVSFLYNLKYFWRNMVKWLSFWN